MGNHTMTAGVNGAHPRSPGHQGPLAVLWGWNQPVGPVVGMATS